MPEGTDRHSDTEEEEGVEEDFVEDPAVEGGKDKGRVRLWEGGGGGGGGAPARSIPRTKHSTATRRGKDFPGRQESRVRINK